MKNEVRNKIYNIAKVSNGFIRTGDLLRAGIRNENISILLKLGEIEKIKHGLYRLLQAPVSEYDTIIQATHCLPRGVVCMLTALSYYGLTTVTPRDVNVAIENNRKFVLPSYPPIKLYYYTQEMYVAGISTIIIDGAEIKIYDKEKTLCDCIKFRQQIGMDVVKEAMREYLHNSSRDLEKLKIYSKICRVKTTLEKYMEILI